MDRPIVTDCVGNAHRPAGGLPDGTLDAIQGHPRPIRHEYFRIDDATLWEVISTETHTLNM
jgi:hypothetical protein